MAKARSKISQIIGRLVKGAVGILLIPPVLGMALGLYRPLKAIGAGEWSCAQWFFWGAASYVGFHLLLYKPRTLFGLNHALLARLAVWLFGGQVSTVGGEGAEAAPAAPKPKGKGKGKGKDKDTKSGAGASTLVVLSPYLVPLYVVLVCVLTWAATQWVSASFLNAFVSLLIGVALCFHLVMTADELQQDRDRFPIEMYLIALTISSLFSLMITGLCLPMALPELSWSSLFGEAASSTGLIYAAIFRTLF